jgi:hypothetical protein
LASHSGDVDIERVPSVSLVQEMQNAVQIGDFASAMQQFEKANYWVRNDVSTFAASIAASRLGNPRLALKLVNQACTMTENEELLNHARTFITSLSIDHIGRVPEKPTTSDIHFISCKNQVNKHDL